MSRAAAQAGFTLVEMLAAVAIFGVLAVMTQQGLMVTMSTDSRLALRRAELAQLQRAVTMLGRELENAAPRTVRGRDGEPHPAMEIEGGSDALIFTRGGLPNPTGRARSGFQRIRYAVDRSSRSFERQVWRRVDPAPLQRPDTVTLLDGVERVRFRVWTPESGWRDTWPDPEDPQTRNRLPEGIEAVLETRRFGVIRRVVSLR